MKIIAIDAATKRPLANFSIQLQIKGQNSGFVSVKTDQNGHFILDEEYMGHQILATTGGAQGGNAGQGPWATATDGVTLLVAVKEKSTTTAGSRK